MTDSADVHGEVLFSSGKHQVIWLGTDEKENEGVVQTNQYLVIEDGKGYLVDPGGVHLFARVVSAVSRYLDLEKIEGIIFSHQDPDVSSGIALWMGVTKARIFISSLWIRFLPHFGIVDTSRVVPIEGASKALAAAGLSFIPAHFLHSPGNWTVYDAAARIVFSSDIGAGVFPPGGQYLFVEDFAAHRPLIEGFHRRYMAGRKALQAWVDALACREIHMIAPQHGAIFRAETVPAFLNWLKNLECGVDILQELNRGAT